MEETNNQKKSFGEKAKDWWAEHWGSVLTISTVAAIGGFGIYAISKAGAAANEQWHEKVIDGLKKLTGVDPETLPGDWEEKKESMTKTLWEQRDLYKFDDELVDKLQELHDVCNDKGIEVSLGAYLGGGKDFMDYCEIEYYTPEGIEVDRID